MSVVVSDPRWDPSEYGPWMRLAVPFLRDERDLVFVRTSLFMASTIVPIGLALLLVPGLVRWYTAILYIAVLLPVFLDRYVLMLHATSHRVLFKREHDWMNRIIPWLLGPFFGHTASAFFVHHMGMHHPENNLFADLSTTMPYQRDKFSHFLHYWARSFVTGTVHLAVYLRRRGRNKLLVRFLAGEFAWYALAAVGLWWNAPGALLVLVFPFVFVRFVMMAGNWSQHAFVDTSDPGNPYRNSITLVNSRHNRRCYNDGYHVVHHLKPNAHWSEMPGLFEVDVDRYARERSLVFENVFSYQKVFVLLMTGNYDKLAEHFVQLGERPLTKHEIVALITERSRATRGRILGLFEIDPWPTPTLADFPLPEDTARAA